MNSEMEDDMYTVEKDGSYFENQQNSDNLKRIKPKNVIREIDPKDKAHQPFQDINAGYGYSDDEPKKAKNIKNMIDPKPVNLNQFEIDEPKAARNMGFPNMKYLDPETLGAPI